MNQQTNMADTAAADLVQQIATSLYGPAGAGITDLITLANRVQVTPAQAVDLGQLREIVSDLSHSAKVDDYEPQHIAFIESIRDRLSALIDSGKAVGNG